MHSLIEFTITDSPTDGHTKQGKLHHHLHFIDRKTESQRGQSTPLGFKSRAIWSAKPMNITPHRIAEPDRTRQVKPNGPEKML